jgi:hypothetical protein
MITVAGVPPFHSDEIEAERSASAAARSAVRCMLLLA